MRTEYEPTLTLSAARDRYFEVNGFGADGGYNDAWVDFKLGPVPMPFPNSPARIRALRFHDLHHVLTGYDTNTIGEFEISGWEIGGGCRDFAAAWILNLGGMAAGLFSAPRRVFRAFVRGRRMQTLYGRDLDTLLHKTVGEIRAEFEPGGNPRAGLVDIVLFMLACTAGLAIGVPLFFLLLPLVPVGILTHMLRRRAAAKVA